ncbi:MAG TPA: hypothetical protein VLE99_05865 [Candidatus Saccharimonadales bacterium]|nr:hypothetical protein [Candidatus Saccharimonadales bacterium]
MEPTQSPPNGSTPGQPNRRPVQPVNRHVFSDFTARPIASRPTSPQPTTPSSAPVSKPAPASSSAPKPKQPETPASVFWSSSPDTEQAHTTSPPPASHSNPTTPTSSDDEPPAPPKIAKRERPRSETAHAGLVGFVFFVILTGLLLSPLLPGKIFSNFPGSSSSSSSGDQALACIDTLKNVTSSLAYNTKAGSPVVYDYSTTTTQRATCDGKPQSFVGARTSQFNPLGLALDIVLSLVVAVVFAKLWKRIFGFKD